ncbi:MAG: DUF3047 domain-containing protein [Elusimicrobia bacterium]|nr:DUF3047 domain-containing protein [Elusimicrobiota bacterium]
MKLLGALVSSLALLPSAPVMGPGSLPEGWEPLTFKRIKSHTRYEWSPKEHAIHALSSAAASGLMYRLDQDAVELPILRWRWRVSHSIPKGDEQRGSGDDYAARIYVTFRYDPSKVGAGTRIKYGLAKALYGEYPPHAGINYIWANRLPKGESTPNAYTNRVMMIAVRSGDGEAGKWNAEERNILEDYRRFFKEDPPPLAGIAIMTDTDSTSSRAEAWYADVELRPSP